MSLVLQSLEDLKEYADSWTIPILYFYDQDLRKFIILSGKVSWKGQLKDADACRDLESWLITKKGRRVKSFESLEDLFK